jgi:hypothetical protein
VPAVVGGDGGDGGGGDGGDGGDDQAAAAAATTVAPPVPAASVMPGYEPDHISVRSGGIFHKLSGDAGKVSPDGFRVTGGLGDFTTAASTVLLRKGKWYYEVTIHDERAAQIGFISNSFEFRPHTGDGVGDDEQSYGYDGFRQMIWNGPTANPYGSDFLTWKEGDVVGVLLDLDNGKIEFELRGESQGTAFTSVKPSSTDDGFLSPAVSIVRGASVTFNLGLKPFAHYSTGGFAGGPNSAKGRGYLAPLGAVAAASGGAMGDDGKPASFAFLNAYSPAARLLGLLAPRIVGGREVERRPFPPALARGILDTLLTKQRAPDPTADLTLKVRHFDSGEQHNGYKCANIVADNENCYCSAEGKPNNVHVVLHHITSLPMKIGHVGVKSPCDGGYSAPVALTCVLVAEELPSSDDLAAYDAVTSEASMTAVYKQQVAKLQQQLGASSGQADAAALQPNLRPIAFVDTSEVQSATVALGAPVTARLIVFKFLTARGQGTNNIDVMRVWAKGTAEDQGVRGATLPTDIRWTKGMDEAIITAVNALPDLGEEAEASQKSFEDALKELSDV